MKMDCGRRGIFYFLRSGQNSQQKRKGRIHEERERVTHLGQFSDKFCLKFARMINGRVQCINDLRHV